ncbi:MAG: nitroreductase [Solobacterium sp.]|nr:nitroreductase [Solobacterium sp.]
MNVLEAIRTRRSVRKYTDKPVPAETLKEIAEAGIWAASGMNTQGPIVLIVTDKAVRDRLSELNAAVMGRPGDPFYGAPYVLVALAPKENPIHVYDGSLVMGNMMLAAHELGLGSCWIHRAKEVFDTEEGKAFLKKAGVEGEYEGIGNLIVGYAAEEPADKERKPGRIFTL